MTKRFISAVVAFGAGLSLVSCSLDQPEPGCIVQDAEDWQVKYTLKPGQTISPACAEKLDLQGEQFGVFKYNTPGNASETRLAIRPEGLAHLADRDPLDENPLSTSASERYRHTAVSTFASERDAENLCAATNFSAAVVNAEEADGDPPEPATNITYQFQNVKMYSAPSAPGTQMGGELTYTRDECTAEFTFRAIWPSVDCVPGSTDPAENCGAGSGLNPDFDVVCDPQLEKCVAAKDIPSFKNEQD